MRPRRYSGVYVSLSVAALPQATRSRVACVVSKKVSLRAVVRNRIKRRCREALAPLLKSVRRPLALVCNAKREAVEASFAEIRDDIARLVMRIE